MQTVSQWLSAMPHIRNVQEVTITIGKSTWHGAQYESVGHYTADMDAVRWGKKKAGDEYVNTMIYLVGTKPNHRRTCYKFADDARDWYCASYMLPENMKPEFAQFHPFGVTWQLAPWDIEGQPESKIDDHEEKPYQRMEAKRS